MKIGFMNNDSNLNYVIKVIMQVTRMLPYNVDADGDAFIVWSK